MEDNTKILEKIQKLLALTDSPNQAEAEVAMAQAQKLLVKYKLTIQAIQSYKKEIPIKEQYANIPFVCGFKRLPQYGGYVCGILKKFFFVEVIILSKGNDQNVKLAFMGKVIDIPIAIHTFYYLNSTFELAWQNYRRSSNAPVSARQAFYYGMFEGICAKLTTERKEVEQECGVVLYEDKGLLKFVNQQFPHLRHISKKVNLNDANARSTGYQIGQNTNFEKPLGSGNSAPKPNLASHARQLLK